MFRLLGYAARNKKIAPSSFLVSFVNWFNPHPHVLPSHTSPFLPSLPSPFLPSNNGVSKLMSRYLQNRVLSLPHDS